MLVGVKEGMDTASIDIDSRPNQTETSGWCLSHRHVDARQYCIWVAFDSTENSEIASAEIGIMANIIQLTEM